MQARVYALRLVSFIAVLLMGASVNAQTTAPEQQFASLYSESLGELVPCRSTALYRYSVCSNALRNEGNAPFMLRHEESTGKVAVLVHGLSDSPFFVREIANVLFDKGYDVIAPLLPGHGLRDADDDMEDRDLAERWQAHVADVVDIAKSMGDSVIIGGFSTGGALSVAHYIAEPNSVDGIMLFSGALALSDNAESLSKIWGIKLLAKFLDGEYQTHGPNPHKYPNVASFAGMELMDIITGIRESIEEGKTIQVPLFAAHSQADVTTPIKGVEMLMEVSKGSNTFFVIDASYDVCHADVVVNETLLNDMNFNANTANTAEPCYIPEVNPLFNQMTLMLQTYLDEL